MSSSTQVTGKRSFTDPATSPAASQKRAKITSEERIAAGAFHELQIATLQEELEELKNRVEHLTSFQEHRMRRLETKAGIALPESVLNPSQSPTTQRLLLPKGSIYVGEVKNGKPDGEGEEYYPDFAHYKGSFKDGKRHGKGEYYCPNGEHYEGSFQEGQFHGKGKLYYLEGGHYEGSFQEGQFHGEGEYYYPNGSHYVGSFQANKFHGEGKYYLAKDELGYEGSFQDGKYHGDGKQFYLSNSRKS